MIKKILLLACGLIISSTVNNLLAQKNNIVQLDLNYDTSKKKSDTLVIKLTGSNKILVIAENLNDLIKYTQADSVKNLFLADIEKSYDNNSLSSEATKVYYFLTTTGKRRLKAENVDLSENEVNIGYELKRIDLDLPKYEYKIFDLKHGYQIQIYLSNSKDLKSELEKISIIDAVKFAHNNAKKDFKRTFKLEVNSENGFEIGNKTQGRMDAMNINGVLGVAILGNTIAPIAGAEAMFILTNKYSVGKLKVGLNYQAFPFVNSINGDIRNISLVNTYSLKALINVNGYEGNDPFYLGLQLGILKSNDIKSFDNAFKIGLLQSSKSLNYSFDFIKDSNKNWVYGLTVYLPF